MLLLLCFMLCVTFHIQLFYQHHTSSFICDRRVMSSVSHTPMRLCTINYHFTFHLKSHFSVRVRELGQRAQTYAIIKRAHFGLLGSPGELSSSHLHTTCTFENQFAASDQISDVKFEWKAEKLTVMLLRSICKCVLLRCEVFGL